MSIQFKESRQQNQQKALDVLTIIKQMNTKHSKQDGRTAKKNYNPCIRPCKKFPPYIPYCTNEDHLSAIVSVPQDTKTTIISTPAAVTVAPATATVASIVNDIAIAAAATAASSANASGPAPPPTTTATTTTVAAAGAAATTKSTNVANHTTSQGQTLSAAVAQTSNTSTSNTIHINSSSSSSNSYSNSNANSNINAQNNNTEENNVAAREWKWNPPHPSSTAFGLFCNKVKNSKVCAYSRRNSNISNHSINSHSSNVSNRNSNSNSNNHKKSASTSSGVTQAEYMKIWNELQDNGKFWMEEATWDQRRYRYQKARYNNARNQAHVGCVVFSYLYYDYNRSGNGDGNDIDLNVSVQLEKRNDRRCPFCWYDGRTDLGLLMHLHTAHGKGQGVGFEMAFDGKKEEYDDPCRMMFHAGIDGSRNLHILVKSFSKREEDEHRYHMGGTRHTMENEDDFLFIREDGMAVDVPLTIPFVKLPVEMTSLLESKTRKKKIRQLEQLVRLGDGNVHPNAISQYVPDGKVPVRQYFHSKTMQPMAPGEWDVDSDDEADDEWAQMLSECVLKELGDVSHKEKMFMNVWNRFMESHSVTADRVVPVKCKNFLTTYHAMLIKEELRDQFLLHLMNLWDNRLIPSRVIVALMKLFDEYDNKKKKGWMGSILHGSDEPDDLVNGDVEVVQQVHVPEVVYGRNGNIHHDNSQHTTNITKAQVQAVGIVEQLHVPEVVNGRRGNFHHDNSSAGNTTNNTNAQVQADIEGSETSCVLRVNDDKDPNEENILNGKKRKIPDDLLQTSTKVRLNPSALEHR